MKKSFLFTIQPALSHLNPMVPVAQGLLNNGHDVAFATAKDFLPFVIEKGFSAFSAGPNWTTENEDQVFPERSQLPVTERGGFDIGVVFADRAPPYMLEDLANLFEKHKPDVIIRDQLEFGGYLAAEKFDIPHATINISAGWQVSSNWLMSTIVKPITNHRRQLGLPVDENLDSLFRFLRLDMAPPSLLPEGYSKSATTHTFNPIHTSGSPPDWVSSLPYSKTVLVTLGTVWNKSIEQFRQIIASIQDENINVIVATGHEIDIEELDFNQPHIKIVPYIPFTSLSGHLDAAIFHGGFVSLLTMIACGVPTVIIPIGADHFMNARLVSNSNTGVGIPSEPLSSSAIRDALRQVIDEPMYKENVLKVKNDMASLPRIDAAVKLLEDLTSNRSPIVANSA